MRRIPFAVPMLLATTLSVGCSSLSQGAASADSSGQGFDEVKVGLNVWFPDVTATVQDRGGAKDVASLNTSDTIDLDEMGVNGRVEMWEGDEGYIIDAQLIDLGSSRAVVGGRVNNHIRDETIDFLVAQRYEVSEDTEDAPAATATIMGGLRVRRLHQRVSASKVGGFSDNNDWVEGVIGAGLTLPASDELSFDLRGDVSGFDIGSGSHRTWNAFAGGTYEIDVSNSVSLGWHVYDINYGHGSGVNKTGLDGRFSGPTLGWNFAF